MQFEFAAKWSSYDGQFSWQISNIRYGSNWPFGVKFGDHYIYDANKMVFLVLAFKNR